MPDVVEPRNVTVIGGMGAGSAPLPPSPVITVHPISEPTPVDGLSYEVSPGRPAPQWLRSAPILFNIDGRLMPVQLEGRSSGSHMSLERAVFTNSEGNRIAVRLTDFVSNTVLLDGPVSGNNTPTFAINPTSNLNGPNTGNTSQLRIAIARGYNSALYRDFTPAMPGQPQSEATLGSLIPQPAQQAAPQPAQATPGNRIP